MNNPTLREMLNAYHPDAPEEREYKKTILAFIEQYPDDCFKRTLEVGHITGSAWLVSKDGSKALLMHHAKLNKWFQLGGHCDGNPDVLAVAIKEAQEESGIMGIIPVHKNIFDIDIHLIPANSREKEHYHYDIRFLLKVTSDELVTQNSESKALSWVNKSLAELPTDSLSVVRMFKKWVAHE